MELTPQVFRDVQFREKLRGGYHPEDVDEFLEQAAQSAEELLARLKSATERAERAERALEEASSSDETLKRVLVMAQRTADQAVREAREEAERLLAEARVQAQAIVADAEERGRRAYDSKVVEARANLDRVEEALRRAQSDAEVLSRWVTTNKAQLLEALREAAALLDKVGSGELPASEQPSASGQPTQSVDLDVTGTGSTNVPPAERSGAAIGSSPALSEVTGGQEQAVQGGPTGSESEGYHGGEAEGGWDPRFLEDLEDGQSRVGVASEASAGLVAGGPGAVPAANLAAGEGAGEDTQPGGSTPRTRYSEEPEDATVAFDEKALDSFFRDQDLRVRGPGRFRRRS